MSKHDSKKVAAALLISLGRYRELLTSKQKISSAERRHLLRLRTVKALRDGSKRLEK